MMKHRSRTALGVIAAAALLAGCTAGEEAQLFPAARDGMFYTVFGDAQRIAVEQDKLIVAENDVIAVTGG